MLAASQSGPTKVSSADFSELDPTTSKNRLSRLKVRTSHSGRKGAGSTMVTMDIAPTTFTNNARGRAVLRERTQVDVRRALRAENLSAGKEGHSAEIHHLLSGSALLSIGRKYLVIPERLKKLSHGEYYSVIGGYMETPKQSFSHQRVQPVRHAVREVHEETGLPIKKLRILSKRFRKVKWSTANPIAFSRNLDKRAASADAIYAIDYQTGDPKQTIANLFREVEDGKFVLRNPPKEEEAKNFAIVPLTVEGLTNFIAENSHRINPISRIGLEGYLYELKRQRAKR
jgi:8-oxo-dGTP pyrophosphatase MutT (NUDIX family)